MKRINPKYWLLPSDERNTLKEVFGGVMFDFFYKELYAKHNGHPVYMKDLYKKLNVSRDALRKVFRGESNDAELYSNLFKEIQQLGDQYEKGKMLSEEYEAFLKFFHEPDLLH